MSAVRHYDDLWFSIAYEIHSHHMSFKVYEHTGQEISGKDFYKPRQFGKKESRNNEDALYEVDEQCAVYMSGEVKWDGCSNIDIDENKNCMLHFCGKRSAGKLGKMIDTVYALALEVLPSADKDLFE